ncbi:MAG TPA: superoxide dismutase family protein [Gemmatimonadales bacterium]|nr:superoxide dismutase family protein [Gemmatimonadales bacterium]
MRPSALLPLLLATSACAVSMGPPRTKPEALRVALFDRDGASVGAVVLTADSAGMTLAFDVHDLSPGAHGVHVHAIGRCERPDFLSAGPHLDVGGHAHGLDNPAGHHLGDLPNLVVGPDGRATATLRLQPRDGKFTPRTLLDSDGSAIIIHAGPDDGHTDPSGNSGARIACGIVA